MPDDETLWVESTRGPDDEPVCLIARKAQGWTLRKAGDRSGIPN